MDLLIGFSLILFAGIMAGSALLPIKFVKNYRFEHYWMIYGLVATVLVPWSLALSLIPNLLAKYALVPWKNLLLPPIFAFGWGVASMLGGLCVPRIGLSLCYALIIGVGAASGTIVPLLYFSPQILHKPAGHAVLFGIFLMAIGLILITWAGKQNETLAGPDRSQGAKTGMRQRTYLVWVSTAVLAGLLSSGLNFSFIFGSAITDQVRAIGVPASNATYAVWAWVMLGGMLPNIGYPCFLCFRNHSWSIFLTSSRRDVTVSLLLGLLFIGSAFLYGLGAIRLGELGTSVGWGIMQIMQIVVGNVTGFLTGEWKHAVAKSVRLMVAGLVILVCASVVMAYGNYIRAN